MANASNGLKSIFKFIPNLFKKAAHGVTFIVGIAKNDQRAFQIQKATGDELLEELNKVQQESAEYKNQGELDDLERIRRSKEQKLTSYRYKVKDSSGKIISNTFEAPTKNDVRVFLQNEGYEVVEIKERSKWDVDLNFSTKIKNGDLSFMLTQLSTYIKAGIPLINSVRILAKQTTNAMHKKILNKVVYELVVGEKFSVALEKQNKTFPTLLINMVKTSEMTGDLPGTLDEMAEYYTEVEKSRKAMISALTYPMVILIVAVVAVVFVIVYVVPQFVGMFASNNAELPGITVFIIAASDFLGKYWLHLLIGIIALIIIYLQMFKRVKSFRKTMQTFYMHLPVIGNVIIYNEVSTLTRTFASLLNHSVFITDSMEILSKLSNNEIYKEIINRTLINLSKGGKISDSFRGEWAFPVVAYEMLVTGESTGQLAVMMEKVAIHYQTLHSNAVTSIKSLIEPVIICFLAVAVGFIIMSIIMPMFDLYGQL
ncbi:MAG: type II secretion system F family protein [Bacilli bacterium]|nr:type II secretion system F family protein [Bacilli bacterium]